MTNIIIIQIILFIIIITLIIKVILMNDYGSTGDKYSKEQYQQWLLSYSNTEIYVYAISLQFSIMMFSQKSEFHFFSTNQKSCIHFEINTQEVLLSYDPKFQERLHLCLVLFFCALLLT